MQRPLLVIFLGALCGAACTQDDGMPFGPVGDAELDRLAIFSKAAGFDLKPEMERVYKKDEAALGRLFKLSLSFKTLDGKSRAYGQVVYSSLLNLGETIGVEAYAKVLDRQPPEVKQRVRDFLYYPILRIPKEHQKEADEETRQAYPTLFPTGYEFGRDNPIFAEGK